MGIKVREIPGRLIQPSSQAAIAGTLWAFGVDLEPGLFQKIITALASISTLIAIFRNDGTAPQPLQAKEQ